MDEHSQGRASRELKAESRRQIDAKRVRQISDAVRMEMNMERYAGDVTEWAGYNATKTPLVLREAKRQKVTKHKECWLKKAGTVKRRKAAVTMSAKKGGKATKGGKAGRVLRKAARRKQQAGAKVAMKQQRSSTAAATRKRGGRRRRPRPRRSRVKEAGQSDCDEDTARA